MGAMRMGAALVALIAWAAVLGQLALNFALPANAGVPAWLIIVNLFGYFTIWSNLLVALVTTGVAAKGLNRGLLTRPATLAAVVVYIVVVGTIYNTLLIGLNPVEGWRKVSDTLLHTVVPLAYPLWWLALVPRGQLAWRALPYALIVPTLYCVWALGRGAVLGKYAYFFIDVGKYGLPQVLLNIAGLVMLFAGLMALLILVDRRASPRVTAA